MHLLRKSGGASVKEVEDFKDPGPPPDGGAEAWTQAVMGHLAAFLCWGYLTSFGAFQAYYQSDLLADKTPSDISWIGSFQVFMIFSVGAFSGRALDAGYFRPVYITGCFLLVFGVFMTSICKTYWQVFLAQAVCSGLGSGLLFTPAIGLVSTYFSQKRTFALAFFLCGSGTGGMVLPAVVSQLLGKVGFGWTLRVVGFILLALSAVTIALFRTRLPPRTTGPLVDWAAFKEKTFALYIVAMFFNFFALYFAFYYISSYGRARLGLSYKEAIHLLIVVNGVGIPGRLIPAWLSDRYVGPINTMIPSSLISALLLFCWAAIKNEGGLYTFAILYGLFANGVQGLWPGGLASLTHDLSKMGTRMGMGFTIVSVALLTGPPIGGALISRDDGRYLYAQMWSGSCFVIGACFLLLARLSKTGFEFRSKV